VDASVIAQNDGPARVVKHDLVNRREIRRGTFRKMQQLRTVILVGVDVSGTGSGCIHPFSRSTPTNFLSIAVTGVAAKFQRSSL
jgi:hypothetical protein